MFAALRPEQSVAMRYSSDPIAPRRLALRGRQ
jgi:hypothetical protein